MNVLQYMNQIEQLITSKRPADSEAWEVFIVDDEVHIGQVKNSVRRDLNIFNLASSDINNGLANWQWYSIAGRLVTLLQEGLLE